MIHARTGLETGVRGKRGLMERWSLIDDAPSNAAFNMAVDEFLLREAEKGMSGPVLRLYSFDPPAVTIGFHQDPSRILDMGALSRDGIDIVRRVTGGRALLHDGELTYSLTAGTDHPSFDGGLQGTFLQISGAVVEALREVGVDARISGGKDRRSPDGSTGSAGNAAGEAGDTGLDSPCLVSTSRHEVTARGRKIVGSAQRRSHSAFLQHGSILLEPASEKISRYLLGDFGDLSSKMTSVKAETERPDAAKSLRDSLVRAFGRVFGAAFEQRRFDDAELEEIGTGALAKSNEFRGGEMT
ncbi:MAG TPA: lipoate--protein ligase family protein, partial [Candidatus Krumholzibacterium sp.]|nr:lipoate--protein ligase family protein [Candidatus Krumholzibacterium sp.]